ncbi:hypothetical protein CR513_06660, partial [Mucuna pruriens]
MAEGSTFIQPTIPRFDGHYDHWAMLMENLLQSNEYWSLVEIRIPKFFAEASQQQLKIVDESKLNDLKVKNYLLQAIDRNIMDIILNRDTAKDIWDSIRQKYQGSTKVKRAQFQPLRREFENLEMKEGKNSAHVWYCRYDHLTLKGLRILAQKEMVKGLSQLKESSRKQHREANPKKSYWRASQRLEIVHIDIYQTIIKQQQKVFKKFEVLVEKESGNSVCCLRTNKGGEFTSSEFDNFYIINGIKRQLTATYTPKQNGVVERKN